MITIRCLNSIKRKHNITDDLIAQVERELNDGYNGDYSIGIQMADDLFESSLYTESAGSFLPEKAHTRMTSLSHNGFVDSCGKLIEAFEKSKQCTHENYTPYSSQEGDTLTNGVVQCDNCHQLSRPNYIAPQGEAKTIMLKGFGLSSERYYVLSCDWNETSIQAGEKGIVISSNGGRKTAFFEAFPTIDGLSTFIRGEGSTIRESEQAAWGKMQKQISCKSHQWTRKVGHFDRTDGHAECTECGLTGKALEPLTKCFKCDKPTTIEHYDKHICQEHHNELTFNELYEHVKVENQSLLSTNSTLEYDTQHQVDIANFEEAICLTFKVAFRDEMLKRKLEYPIKNDMLDFYFLCSYKENVFEIESYEKPPMALDLTTGFMADNLANIRKNMPDFVDLWCKDNGNEASFSPLIKGCYRTPFPKKEAQ